jgi:hypothetical protein
LISLEKIEYVKKNIEMINRMIGQMEEDALEMICSNNNNNSDIDNDNIYVNL